MSKSIFLLRSRNARAAAVRPVVSSSKKSARLALAVGAAVALLPQLSFAAGAIWYWTGNGNANLQNGPNWADFNHVQQTGNILDFADGEGTGTANGAGADSLIFSSADTAFVSSTGGPLTFNTTRTAVAINAPGGIDLGVALHTFRSITFEAGTLGFTIGPLATVPFVLGDSTDPAVNGDNTGNITNNSVLTQTFNQPVEFRFGTVSAAEGQIVFQQTVNVGHNLIGATNNLTIDGSSGTAGQSVVTINGALQGLGTDTSDGGALIKNGSGTLILNANNSAWNGRILINDGSVLVGSNTALGSTAGRTTLGGGFSTGNVKFSSTATTTTTITENFYLNGRSNTNTPGFVNAGGVFNVSSPVTLQSGGEEYGFRSDAGSLTISGNVAYGTASGSTNLRLSGASDGLVSGTIGTGGQAISVIKEGAGTWTLSGANSYTGLTRVSGGRLNITTAQNGGGDVDVDAVATLALTRAAAGQTLAATSLTLGSSTGGTLLFDLGNFGTSANPVINTVDFTTNGVSTITVAGGGLSIGTIPLIDYVGGIQGNGFGGLSLAGLPPRVTAALVNDTVGTKISLNITAFDFPKWTGNIDGNWDINNGTNPAIGSGTQNWKEANSGTITRYLQQGGTVDSVLFDDTATGTTDVTLTAVVSPITLTVNNNAKTYSFYGAGRISGGTNILKQGPGTLVLANTGANDYTGTTTISAGVMQIGDGATPGAGQFGNGPVINNGSIVLNRAVGENYTFPTNVSGTGSITKIGDNIVTLTGASTFSGPVTVSGGTLKLGSNTALGSTAGGVNVTPGGTFDVGDFQAPTGEVITISGTGGGANAGALISSGPTGGTTAGLHNLALAADASIGGTKRFDVRDGSLAGGGFTLTKTGVNAISLANLGETNLGNIIVDNGRLTFEGTTTFGVSPGTVQVSSTGELGFENSTVVQAKAVQINGGKVVFNTGTANQLSGPVTLASAQINTFQGPTAVAATLTVSGNIDGGGSLNKTQLGTVVLSGANTYSGGTVINSGAVLFSNATSVPATGQILLGASSTVGFGFDFDQTFLTSRVTASLNAATLALGVDTTNNYNFASYPSLSLGAYNSVTYGGTLTPAGTSAGGAYNLGGGGGSLTYTGVLSGNNTLNIGAGGSPGTVILSGANTFTGRTTIATGSTLILANASALGPIANPLTNAGLLDLNGNNLTVGGLTAAQNAVNVVVTDNSVGAGTTVLTDNVASGSTTYGSAIKDGANGKKLALVKAGAGALILNGANLNTFTGGTTISGGRLDVRTNAAQVLPAGMNLSFTGNGTFAPTNNGTGAVTLTLGTLAFNGGEGVLESNNLGAGAGSAVLTFTALPTRAPGATGNFVLVNTTNAATYKVVFAAAPTTGQSLDGGLFYGDSNFAAYNPGGTAATSYVRALTYGTDPNATDIVLSEDQPAFGIVTGKDVQLGGAAFSLTNQTTESVRSLKITGQNNLTLNTGATLTISGGGLLKTGGNASIISGGDALTTGGAADLVVRTVTSTDSLTINTNIAATTTGGLTKSGAGTLVLGGTANTFTGGIWVDSGTLRFTSADAIPATGDIRLGPSTTLGFGHAFDQALLAARVPVTANAATIALGVDNSNNFDFSSTGLNYNAISLGSTGTVTYSGTLTPNATVYRLGGGGGTITFSSPLTGANSLVVGGSGSAGTVVLTAANSYTGGTTLTLGTLRLGNASALGSAGPISITGGILDLRGFDQTLTNLSGNGGTITDNTAATTATTNLTVLIPSGSRTYSGSINNGTGGRLLKLIKDGLGTLVLSKANGNSYSGGTVLKSGRLEVRTQNAQVLAIGSPLTFNGTATFAAANNGDNTVTTAGLTLGALTLNAGDATIESSQSSTSTTNTLTFGAAPVRFSGATANFTLGVASDPSLYKVVFTSATATGQSIDGGLFYNFANFLAYDAAGYARALRYTGTPDANATDVSLSADQSTLGTGLTGRDVQLGGAAGSITAQTSESLRSLKIAAATNLTLDVGQTLTIAGGGLLKTGSSSSVISGGSGLTSGGAADLVARVDTFDTLEIATPILASTTGGLTKTGLGTLILSAANTYGGNTVINSGTVVVNGSITGTTAVTVNRGGTLSGTGTIATAANGNVTVASGGLLAPGASVGTLTLNLGTGSLDLSPSAGGSGWLKFELGVSSDVVALASGSLNLGTGGLDLDDFTFTDSGGFNNGTYTLFDTNADILGTLGTNLTRSILGKDVTLTFANGINGRDDLVLVVVPEPGSATALLGGLGLLAGWRRLGRRRSPAATSSSLQ